MYREPEPVTRSQLEIDLSAASADVVADALISSAYFEEPSWALEQLLNASNDQRPDVIIAALMGFYAMARRGLLPTDRQIWRALLHAADNPDFAGVAEDVMDDLEIFGTTGSRSTWQETAVALSRHLRWEHEDYAVIDA